VKGNSRSRRLASRFGRELRIARVTSGLSQKRLALIVGVTQQLVSLAELGDPSVSLEVRCRLSAACGHELGWRLYPVTSVRLRDSGQMALAQGIVREVHASWTSRLEVPVAPGDARAADVLLVGRDEIIHLEIERTLVDFQAQLRAAQLKREALSERSQKPVRLVIAVPDTAATRDRLRPFTELIARVMSAGSRRIWAAIRSGEPLGGDGILFVRTRRTGGADTGRR
jgi:transcriptional regulator with XRE-family HTH domain